MRIEQLPITALKPYKNNARLHPQHQLQQITDSIKEFGFNNPILIDENNQIIAGHGRLEAAKKLNLENVPCITLPHLNTAQKKAYIIADNKIALNASWDFDLLKVEFESLQDDNFDVALTGFDADELNSILNPEILNEGLCDADEVPEIKADPITKLGDIWLLGEHRLKCANSTCPEAVDRLMNGIKPNLMVTDPPYGVNYSPEWRENAYLGVGNRSIGKVENDNIADWSEAYSLFTGDIVYIWHAGIFSADIVTHLRNCNFDIVSQIIGAKNNFAISRGDYHWKHEPCWYAVRKGKNHNWQGARDQSTLWEINNTHQVDENAKTGHGTQKPIECMLRPIQNNSSPNEFIYDPFGGSGTTLIACEKLGRKCLMMELSPQYCDIIIKRWQKFTGKKAILESTGEAYEEIVRS